MIEGESKLAGQLTRKRTISLSADEQQTRTQVHPSSFFPLFSVSSSFLCVCACVQTLLRSKNKNISQSFDQTFAIRIHRHHHEWLCDPQKEQMAKGWEGLQWRWKTSANFNFYQNVGEIFQGSSNKLPFSMSELKFGKRTEEGCISNCLKKIAKFFWKSIT